ncbi:MAG: TlpA family protein disulfide reductase [Bacteroidia bacterium]
MKKNYIAILGLLLSFSLTNCEDDKKTTDTDSVETTASVPAEDGLVKVVAPNGDTLVKDAEGQIVRTILKSGQIIETQETGTPFQQEKPFYISGTLVEGGGANIILDRLSIGKMKPLFSQTVNKEGLFDFEGAISEPQLMQFRLPAGNIHFIVKPGDTLNFQMHLQNTSTYSVIGSPESMQLKEMYEILNRANEKKRALEERIKSTNDKQQLKQLYISKPAQYAAIDEIKFAELKKFITKIGTSFTALPASLYLKPETNIEFLEELDKKFANLYPTSEYYKALHEKVVTYAPIAIGKFAPEIMSQTPEGATFKLTSTRGKYILIDFWASWCAPCRQENPNVKKLYDKYKSKGFEIVSVSFDKDPVAWKKAIAEDKMNWIHVSDLLEFQSAAAQTYIITAIPSTFLLDRDGRIIAKNLRGKELERKLAEVIK